MENVRIALIKVRHMRPLRCHPPGPGRTGARGAFRQGRVVSGPAFRWTETERVSIARALAMDPKVMLLDEPTSALDPELIGEVLAVIRDLAAAGMTMLMATHQISFSSSLADEFVFMEHGQIVEQGTPKQLLLPGVRFAYCGILRQNNRAFRRGRLDGLGSVCLGVSGQAYAAT